MKNVWMVMFFDKGTPKQQFNKVFDAPKYKVQRYAKALLKGLGCTKVKEEKGHDIFFGQLPSEKSARYAVKIERHILRGTDDDYLSERFERTRG